MTITAVAILRGQRFAGLDIAGKHRQVGETGTVERSDDRFRHATRSANQHRQARVELVACDQIRDSFVVSVGCREHAVIVHDRVHRLDRCGGVLDNIHKLKHCLFERHRNGTTADAQATDSGDGILNIAGREGFVDEMEAEFFVQIIVKARAEIRGARGQRDAQRHVFVEDRH